MFSSHFCFFWYVHIRGGREIRTSDIRFIRRDPSQVLIFFLYVESFLISYSGSWGLDRFEIRYGQTIIFMTWVLILTGGSAS